jgi:hypothetical protein
VIRFDVTRVGQAPGGCEEFAGKQHECLSTHLVEYNNPCVLNDEGGGLRKQRASYGRGGYRCNRRTASSVRVCV